jgi:hypothetical protein
MPFAPRIALALAVSAAALAQAASQAQQAPPTANLQGVWDLTWTTRRGPEQKGYLRITQQGAALRAEIHGQGRINARGTVSGRRFDLRGSRMLVPYRIQGQVNGNRMEGVLKVMSVERRFTGNRRGG